MNKLKGKKPNTSKSQSLDTVASTTALPSRISSRPGESNGLYPPTEASVVSNWDISDVLGHSATTSPEDSMDISNPNLTKRRPKTPILSNKSPTSPPIENIQSSLSNHALNLSSTDSTLKENLLLKPKSSSFSDLDRLDVSELVDIKPSEKSKEESIPIYTISKSVSLTRIEQIGITRQQATNPNALKTRSSSAKLSKLTSTSSMKIIQEEGG